MRTKLAWGFGALATLALTVLVVLALRSSPQLGSDPAVMKTVDALFTAVTKRDSKLVADCEANLAAHRAAGLLPDGADAELARVIEIANGGDWRRAAKRLYAFIEAQRREGAVEPAPPPVVRRKGK